MTDCEGKPRANGSEVALGDGSVGVSRKLRILLLLYTAERAGIAPVGVAKLHAFAYLANVLSPVWEMPALDGSLLKSHGGPFYPMLQEEVDALVGQGLVRISAIGYTEDPEGRPRLSGSFSLNHRFSDDVIAYVRQCQDDDAELEYLQELAYAVSVLSDDEMGRAMAEDVTFADPTISFGNVLDFAQWRTDNLSATAAERFDNVMPMAGQASAGEKLHFYVRHLLRNARAG